MATEAQKAMLPSMAGGQNDGGVSEYEKDQLRIKEAQAAKAKADLAAVIKRGVNVAPGTPDVQELSDALKQAVEPPAPPKPAPDPEMYWVNPYGQVLSTRKGPAQLVLTVTNECTTKQLDAIVRLLNDNPELT
jgi:hypothetical protein